MVNTTTTTTKSVEDEKGSPNKTYPEHPPRKLLAIERIVKFLIGTAIFDEDGRVLETGQTIAISGFHGIGKSSFIRWIIEKLGFVYVGIALPTIEVPDLYLPFPRKVKEFVGAALEQWVLEMHLADKLQPGTPWVLHGMDWRRVQPQVMSALMEITNEHTLTGIPLDQLVGVILDDNPVGEGYQGVISGDLAVETRMPHFVVDANDIPWREAVAHMFPDVDCKPVFKAWASLTPELRYVFPPRVLEHVMRVTLLDLPPIYGLPILPSGRQRLIDNGQDRTEEVLREIAAGLGRSYQVPGPDSAMQALNVAVRHGLSTHIVGPCGVAKTASVKALASTDGFEDLDVVIFSAANMQPGDLAAPVPIDGKVKWLKNQRLMEVPGKRKLVVFDVMFRATKAVKPQMLELFQEKRVCGEPIEAVAVWAINNPAQHGALTFRVGQADQALCSRFVVNVEVTAKDTRWEEYLRGVYGAEKVKPFIDFWRHSLDDTGRDYVSPRVLEMMLKLHLAGLDIENALPFLGKERLPVRLHELKARLADRTVLGFEQIVQDSEDILDTLRSTGDSATKADVEMSVTRALQKTEVSELKQHEDLCVEILSLLPKDKAIKLIKVDNDAGRQQFWTQVFLKV